MMTRATRMFFVLFVFSTATHGAIYECQIEADLPSTSPTVKRTLNVNTEKGGESSVACLHDCADEDGIRVYCGMRDGISAREDDLYCYIEKTVWFTDVTNLGEAAIATSSNRALWLYTKDKNSSFKIHCRKK